MHTFRTEKVFLGQCTLQFGQFSGLKCVSLVRFCCRHSRCNRFEMLPGKVYGTMQNFTFSWLTRVHSALPWMAFGLQMSLAKAMILHVSVCALHAFILPSHFPWPSITENCFFCTGNKLYCVQMCAYLFYPTRSKGRSGSRFDLFQILIKLS